MEVYIMSAIKKIEFSTTLSNRGQITVPQSLREKLGITLDQKAHLKVVIQLEDASEEINNRKSKLKAFNEALTNLTLETDEKFDVVDWLKEERGEH